MRSATSKYHLVKKTVRRIKMICIKKEWVMLFVVILPQTIGMRYRVLPSGKLSATEIDGASEPLAIECGMCRQI